MRGGTVKLKWLHQQFSVDPLPAVQAQQYARGYILHMINTILFPDYSTSKVHLNGTSLGGF